MKQALLGFLKLACYLLGLVQIYLLIERKLGWKRSVVSLCYHSTPAEAPTEAISMLESGNCRATLDAQINILSKWLQPIDDSTLLAWLNRKVTLDRDGLLITFDDGYKNNQTVAGPILKNYGVPGLIFIPTDSITSRNLFWWTRVSNVMRHIDPTAWKTLTDHELPGPVLKIIAAEDLSSWASRKQARRRLAIWLDRQDSPDPTLTTIESATSRKQVESTPKQMELLEWDDLNLMQNDLFCFGSHTHTHPRLTKLTDEAIQNELGTGCQELFQRLKQWPISLAYPAGDFDDRVANCAKTAGFDMAFTTLAGIIDRQSDRMKLPRFYLGYSKPHEIYFFLAIINLAKYFPKKLAGRLMKLAR